MVAMCVAIIGKITKIAVVTEEVTMTTSKAGEIMETVVETEVAMTIVIAIEEMTVYGREILLAVVKEMNLFKLEHLVDSRIRVHVAARTRMSRKKGGTSVATFPEFLRCFPSFKKDKVEEKYENSRNIERRTSTYIM